MKLKSAYISWFIKTILYILYLIKKIMYITENVCLLINILRKTQYNFPVIFYQLKKLQVNTKLEGPTTKKITFLYFFVIYIYTHIFLGKQRIYKLHSTIRYWTECYITWYFITLLQRIVNSKETKVK